VSLHCNSTHTGTASQARSPEFPHGLAVGDVSPTPERQSERAERIVTDAGSLQSLSWGASAGGSSTAYLSGSCCNTSAQTIFLITASFPLIVHQQQLEVGAEEKITKRTDFETVKRMRLLKQLRGSKKNSCAHRRSLPLLRSHPKLRLRASSFFTTNELSFPQNFSASAYSLPALPPSPTSG